MHIHPPPPYLSSFDCTENPFLQVVFLGAGDVFVVCVARLVTRFFAGLDMRASRLPCLASGAATVFECDYEEVVDICAF